MHSHHEILVRASSKEEAIGNAKEEISYYSNGEVWDWYVVGGRWSGFHTQVNTGTWPEYRDQYKQEGYLDDVICYIDSPALFRACIESQLKNQREDLSRLLGMLKLKDKLRLLFNRVRTSHDGDDGMFGHYLYNIGKHVAGYYNFSSYFYNPKWGGPDMPDKMWAEIELEPTQWWLITVDLHN